MGKLDQVIESINKANGQNTVMTLGSKEYTNVEAISSGSIGLDIALGIGGYPRGRVIEIYGQEGTAKTSLAIHAIAESQKKGGKCAIIDAEHAFDREYAENLGVDVDGLFICQPNSGDQALEIADQLICSGELSIVVVDSVAALIPKAELEGEIGDNRIGLHARLMSQAMKKLAVSANKHNCTLIMLNQLREKIGVMFGNPSVTTGGNALKYFASVRIETSKSVSAENQVKDGNDIIGNLIKTKVVKNKVAPPFKTAEFNVIYGEGIDKNGEAIKYAVDLDIIVKSGSWYSYEGVKIGQGMPSVIKFLADNPEVREKIEEQLKEKLKNG